MKEFWNERFAATEYIYGENPNDFFANELLKYSPGKISLPGEGEGRNAVFAAKNNWNVFAYDYSESGKIKALNLAEKNNVEIDYKICNLVECEYPINEFDAASIIFVHFNENERRIVHKKIADSLKIGGILIVELFSKEQISYNTGGPKNIDMLYTEDILKNDFSCFNIVFLEKSEIILHEGKYHQGKASVIRFVAEKNNY